MKNIVLGTYEIELLSLNTIKDIVFNFSKNGGEYIDTAISYNNDYILSKVLTKELKVISKCPPQMTSHYQEFMKTHLEILGRDKIDIMLIHNPRSDWKSLAEMMELDSRIDEVGVSNFGIDELNLYKEYFGHFPKYNEIEINPSYYEGDLIKFCKDNDIKIIAYAILGGKYNALRNISKYTLPALISLATASADLVIWRVDSIDQLDQCILANKYQFNNPFIIIEDKLSKSIVPMEYQIPMFNEVSVNKIKFPTYDKYKGGNVFDFSDSKFGIIDTGSIVNQRINILMTRLRDLLTKDIPDFEFITDYRVWVRYCIQGLINTFLPNKFELKYVGDFLRVKDKDTEEILFINVYLINKETLTKINSEGSVFNFVMILGNKSI